MTRGSVALFPGQGSQAIGMGKEIFNDFKIARETFEEASDSTHLDIKTLCFEGPEHELNMTENTQPCLLTASIAAFRVAETEFGFTPAAVAGHSLGEYSALVAARALSFSSAVRWVRDRGLAMQEAVPKNQGTMAAIMNLADSVVEDLCRTATEEAKSARAKGENSELTIDAVVEPANYNSPSQLVIAGSVDAVAKALELIKTGGGSGRFAGGRAVQLEVSVPSHCKLMAPASDRLSKLFLSAKETERPSQLICPYIPNRTGRLTSEPSLVFEFLIEQLSKPVLWKQSIKAFMDAGFVDAFEFGPGKVLQGLARRITKETGGQFNVVGAGDTASIRTLEKKETS